MFELHPGIESSSLALGAWPLSLVRLLPDARFPWLVLVPQRAGVVELEELSREDRAELIEEAVRAGRVVRAIGAALGRPVQKLNVGALGNHTAQLHLHVVGRRSDDYAWPGPVWGASEAQEYEEADLALAMAAARAAMAA